MLYFSKIIELSQNNLQCNLPLKRSITKLFTATQLLQQFQENKKNTPKYSFSIAQDISMQLPHYRPKQFKIIWGEV